MSRWYLGKSSNARMEIAKRKILSLIPPEPDKIRMKELIAKATEGDPKINRSTVWRRVDQLVKDGMVRRISVAHKKVYYQRTYQGKNELALSEVREKAYETLSELKDIKSWERTSEVYTELGIIEISIKVERK